MRSLVEISKNMLYIACKMLAETYWKKRITEEEYLVCRIFG